MAKPSKLAGALAKDPRGGRVSTMPVGKPPTRQNKNAADMAAGLAQKRAGLQRLSPGVYRNAQGGLVNSHGGALPGQRPQQPQKPMAPQQRAPQQVDPNQQSAANYANQAAQNYMQQQPSWRPPAPNQDGMRRSMVMPDIGSQGGYPVWNGPGNGPGSPSDVNPWYGQSNMQPPMNDLMYNYPQGQAPDFGSMFRYFEQQRQQPNSVSGILQQGGQQQQGTSMISEEAAAQAQNSPYYNNPQANPYWKPYNS